MDFQSLSRKELQLLCKKNKIPANMTNIAMADALEALDKVEGLDEFTNATQLHPQQSPEKAMAGSTEIPQTCCKTLIRKKPLHIETGSSQKTLNRTRCTTRSKVAVLGDQENKNSNHTETPAMPGSRIRTSAASARRTMETQMKDSVEDKEKSNATKTPVARSSRRMDPAVSARRKVEAQKEGISSVQRVYSTRHSVRLLEKSMEELALKEKGRVGPLKMDELCKQIEGVEVNEESGPDLLTVPEKSSDEDTDIEEISCQSKDHSLEDERETKHELQEEGKCDEYEVEDYNAKQETGSGKCDASEVLVLDNESEMNNELEGDNKNNDCEVDPWDPNFEGLNGQEEDSNESVEKSNPILVESSDEAVPMNQEPGYENGTVKYGVMVSDSPTLKVSEFIDENSEMISTEDKQHDNYDLQSNFEIEGESDSNQSVEYNNETVVEISVMEVDMIVHESLNQTTSSCTLDSDIDSGKVPLHKLHENISSETLIDITVMSQEEFNIAAAPTLGMAPASPCQPLVAGAAMTGISSSPFAADTLQGQSPRPTELTPRKSSTKKQQSFWKVIDALEINKENIDESGKKVEPKKEKAVNKVIGEKILDECSLRQLRKMMKEKLQIANNKNNEEDNDTKVGKIRLALQTLADENRGHVAAESEN